MQAHPAQGVQGGSAALEQTLWASGKVDAKRQRWKDGTSIREGKEVDLEDEDKAAQETLLGF